MISAKKHIQQLASILYLKGMNDVVISPGSRNGPLIDTFSCSGKFDCRSIVDERSAGYFAVGLAQAKQQAVVLVCTSGTAALNYAPAVAEAFYQHIPLVVLTADRPEYLTDQGEGQTIRQQNIYRDFCKKEVMLPLGESEKELWHAARMINEALNDSVWRMAGPVHINVPLEEPLYELADIDLPPVKIIETSPVKIRLPEREVERLAAAFRESPKVLIVAGQQHRDPELEKTLAELAEKSGALILKEHLANLDHPLFCHHPDLVIPSLPSSSASAYQPDLLITFGGMIVSKSLKQFLRKNPPREHWQLGLSNEHTDTFLALTRVIPMESLTFFRQISPHVEFREQNYLHRWKKREQQVLPIRDEFIGQVDFCDLRVFNQLSSKMPGSLVVHLGNSSPVRYALLCDGMRDTTYLGNRGTSGIDGCLSTAVGFASVSQKINAVVLGDLSFFYDSNALWNHFVGDNLRIIVIHNGGGNIFSLIQGPANSPAFNEHFFTENKISAAGMAHTFGIDYFKAENETELETALQTLFSPEQKKAALLEVFTDAGRNAKAFRELFKRIKDTMREVPDQAGM